MNSENRYEFVSVPNTKLIPAGVYVYLIVVVIVVIDYVIVVQIKIWFWFSDSIYLIRYDFCTEGFKL